MARSQAARKSARLQRVIAPRPASPAPIPAEVPAIAENPDLYLGRVLRLTRQLQRMEKERDQAALDARAAGASWRDLGAALGTTGEAASMRLRGMNRRNRNQGAGSSS